MLVLFETPAGFALFKVLDEGKLSKVEVSSHSSLIHFFCFLFFVFVFIEAYFLCMLQDLWKDFSSTDSARKVKFGRSYLRFIVLSVSFVDISCIIRPFLSLFCLIIYELCKVFNFMCHAFFIYLI